MSPVFRRNVLQIHRWSGLTIGLLVTWMAVTGALLVFRAQLEPVSAPSLFQTAPCTARLPIDRLTDTARAAHPEGKIDFIRIFDRDDRATIIRFGGRDLVYLNPCTGAVQGIENRYGGVFGTLEFLHRFLFLNGNDLIAGTSALVFAFLLIGGGIIVWWPATRRAFKHAIKLNPRLTGRNRTLNRHKTLGLYASLFMLISALTGVQQAFDWYKNGIYWITGSVLPDPEVFKSTPPSDDAKRLPMETLWQHTKTLIPHPQEAVLKYPEVPSDAVEIFAIPSDAPHANARSYLYLDAYSDDVLSFQPYATSSLGQRLYFWFLSIHTGMAGIILQCLILIGALTVPYLAYTGISSYLKRKAPARRPVPTIAE